MVAPAQFKCVSSFFFTTAEGVDVFVPTGAVVDAKDLRYKGREVLFVPFSTDQP